MLAIVAVLLPTTILSVFQYRSLVDLEDKTKVAIQENLRQTMYSVVRKVAGNMKIIAKDSLYSIEPRTIEGICPEEASTRLDALRKSHPEIGQLFAIIDCPCKKGFAIFSTPEGTRRIERAQFKENPGVTGAMKAYESAHLSSNSMGTKPELLFWQTPTICEGVEKHFSDVYIFTPLFDPAKKEPVGFAGLILNQEYLRAQFFPEIIPDMLRNSETEGNDTDLIMGIMYEDWHEFYATKDGAKEYEVKMGFGPLFPKWYLAIGYKDTTIEALAKDNFQKSLMLTFSVLLLLLAGMILTLRATAREVKLAQAKSTFVSNVSHELKTPLALIRLFAETLELGRVRNPEKAQEYYRIINNESRRLTQLINNILDFAKIEAGRKEYEFVQASVAEVVEDVIRSYEYQIASAGFELVTDIEPDVPLALIDRDAISQAVLNLLNNSIKYSEENKHITVRVRGRGDRVAIEVADRGIGIPRSEQGKVFEKFYRVSAGLVHNTKGTGLGLALVKHITEAHDGQILVESTPGKGSRFTILIPALQTAPATDDLRLDAGGYEIAESANN